MILLACGEPPAQAVAPGSTGGSSSSEAGESSSEEDSSSTGPGEVPAPDASVTQVEFSQGAGSLLFDGEVVAPPERAAVVAGRPARLDVQWSTTTDDEVRARLELVDEDAGALTFEDVRRGGEDFVFELAADDVRPGATWQITLWETEIGPDAGDDTNAVPTEPQQLGVHPGPARLKIRIVPLENLAEVEGCPLPAPEIDDEARQRIEDGLYNLYPVEAVDISVREPVPWAGSMVTEFEQAAVYIKLAELRVEDEADPAEHYVALIRPCRNAQGEAISPTAGFSILNDDPAEQAEVVPGRRVLVALYVDEDLDFVFDEHIAHEIGHNLGRRHVACVGTEAGPDPDYPHDDGSIGVRGWSPLDGEFRPAQSPELMGYCPGDRWVSAYGWDLVHPVIVESSSW